MRRNTAACKVALRNRMKHAHGKKERGKALGAYQKCIKGKAGRKTTRRKTRRRTRTRRRKSCR